MGEKNGVWEDNDSETLEHKTAAKMPTLRDRAGRDMAGCSLEPLRKYSVRSRSIHPFCLLAGAARRL